MAQGDVTRFEEFSLQLADGTFDMDTDSFSLKLITTLPTANQTTPSLSDFTEVTAGGGYTTGGIALTTTWTESGGAATFDSSTNPAWTAAAGSPTNIIAGLIVNGSDNAVAFVDLTTDGSTAISLVDGNITVTWNASGIFTIN